MTEAIVQPITQQFNVEILGTDENGVHYPVASALAQAITAWDREFNEAEEDDDSDGFLVSGDEGEGEESGDEDEDEADDSEVEEPSDSVLSLITQVNAAVLADIKALQDMDADERILVRISYGDGLLVRQFLISPDIGVLLSSGEQTSAVLLLTVQADVFESETNF